MVFKKDFLRYTLINAVIFLWVMIPNLLNAQDSVTASEIEKARQVRQELLESGYLQNQQVEPDAAFADSEPIITYSEYTNDRLLVVTDGSRATDFSDNGKRFYILGRTSMSIAEYHLSSSWNIESADFERELDISSEMGTRDQNEQVPHGLFIRKSDGEKMWVLNRTEIWEYTLSTPWDISSASPTGYKNLKEHVVRGHDIDFSSNGRTLYVDDRISEIVFQYKLSSSWDVESATLDYAFDMSAQQEAVRGTQFSPDGNRMFLMDTDRQRILEYYVSDSFNLRSANFIGSYSVASQSSNPRGLTFKPDLSRFYVTDNTENRVYEYRVAIVDPDKSSLSTSNEKVIADGSAESRITVTLRDASGSRISGRTVELSSNSSNVNIEAINSKTNSSGEARFDISNSAEETVTITARSMGITLDDKVSVRFVKLDPDESSVSSNREKVIADGSTIGKITVVARDDEGDKLGNVQISLTANSSKVDIKNSSQNTNSDGEAVFEVSNSSAESVRFSARGMGVTIDDEVTIRFVTVDAEESSVALQKNKVQANGVQSSKITVIARDEDGDELADLEISLIPDGGSSAIEAIQKKTDEDGLAEFKVTNKKAEVVKYRAKGLGVIIGEEVSVNFIPVDPNESEISISTQKVLANGTAEATIKVTARDEDGNAFSNIDFTIKQSGGNSTITNVQRKTDSEGIAIFRVKNENTEEITYSASAMGITINQIVSAKFVTVDLDESTISVNPEKVQADGEEESRITVTTRDKDGDTLEGARVILKAMNGNSMIDDPEKLTDSNGKAVFNLTNTTPQIVTYKVTAEEIEFLDDITVGFIPIAPVALAADEIQTRAFNANWEMVKGANYYLIDVSMDSTFTNLINPYDEFDTGNVTSFTVDNVSPGTTYLYRVKAVSDGLIGANSQPIQTTTFPDIPIAISASNRNALKFTANWQEAEGARKYRLDVALDSSFKNLHPSYNNIDVGNTLSYNVNNLEPGTRYYYRVRSEAGPRVSHSSNPIETSTLTISSDQSEISSDQLKVLANGDQSNKIKIVVKSEEGILLEGLEVNLNQNNDLSEIKSIQSVTDESGTAIFEATSTSAGKVTYTAIATGKTVGEISVEFLENDGILRLGSNFPNPFKGRTILPLTVPRQMMIEIKVYNSLGIPVKTVINEQLNEGYYEVPFESQELASGVYFYRLITDEDVKTEKMILVK